MSTLPKAVYAAFALALAVAASAGHAADAPAFYQLQSVLNFGGTGTSWDHIDYDQSRHLASIEPPSRRPDRG